MVSPALKYHQDCKSFSIGGKGERKKAAHPSPKPYSIVRWFLSILPGDEIVDYFAGSGTTLRAAKDLGKRAIGIEREESYCRYIADRMSQNVLFAENNFSLTGEEALSVLDVDFIESEEVSLCQ
jgi:DNA modification methylase